MKNYFINYMKHFFVILLSVVAVAFVSCKDDKTGTDDGQWFAQPQTTAVTGTTAEVICQTGFADGVLATSSVGFTYAPVDDEGGLGAFVDASSFTADGNVLRTRLSGLTPETTYQVYAFMDMGSSRVLSPAAAFTTLELAPDETVLEITSLTTLPAIAEAKVYTITYTVINPVDEETHALASCPDAWVHSFDYSVRGEVTFDVDANPGAERSTVVTLSYPQADPQQVTVVQRAVEATPPQPESTVIDLSASSGGWPTAYTKTTARVGDFYYALNDVAVFGSNEYIQFKRSSGYMANAEDKGPIRSIEVVYTGNSGKLALFLGDQEQPEGSALGVQAVTRPSSVEVEPTISGDTYVFDCSEYDYSYFTLCSQNSVCYAQSVKIVCGGNEDRPEPVAKPAFGSPTYSALTKNSATIACEYTYTGTGAISEAYFLYAAASGSEQRVNLSSVQPGTKSASLTGLVASTRYTFRLCVTVDGETYKSADGAFTTLDESGKPIATTRYPGWAELVPEDATKLNTEYFYAYHLCPDYPSSGTKARNFTTCYSKSMRCPVWVAAPLHDCYTGSAKRTNAYRTDPDIKCTQVEKRDGYTRGHMLGSAERTVTTATNRDVFYVSNIGPQLSTYFNTGGGQWNTAEDWVDKQWRNLTDTCYQVVGSYWENTNTVASTTTIPTHYYIVLLKAKKSAGKKWVVNCSADELQTIAIMVRHKAYSKSEVIKPDQFQSKGVFKPVAEIERLTGHTFFPNVPNAPKDAYNPSDWNF